MTTQELQTRIIGRFQGRAVIILNEVDNGARYSNNWVWVRWEKSKSKFQVKAEEIE